MPDVNYTPHDWAAAEFVTDTLMDAEVRDPWTNIQSAWTVFTPTWSGSTSPAIGNGVFDCAYRRIGKTILFRITITMGSTTTYGTGQWNFTMPVNPKTDHLRFGSGDAFDSSAGFDYPCAGIWSAGPARLLIVTPATTAGNQDRTLTNLAPFTWATGDVFAINGEYEVA